MKTFREKRFKVALLVGTTLALASCGGKEPRREGPDPAEAARAEAARQQAEAERQAGLGEQTTSPFDQPVVESREVTRTISSEIPAVRITELRGDINRMNATNFEVLGLSPELAQNVITYRTSLGGKFASADQLRKVPGMNDAEFAKIQPKVAVGK